MVAESGWSEEAEIPSLTYTILPCLDYPTLAYIVGEGIFLPTLPTLSYMSYIILHVC